MNLDGKHNIIFQDLKTKSKIHKSTAKKVFSRLCYILLPKFYIMMKVVFFHKNQLGIGVGWWKLTKLCQKKDLELCLVNFT